MSNCVEKQTNAVIHVDQLGHHVNGHLTLGISVNFHLGHSVLLLFCYNGVVFYVLT